MEYYSDIIGVKISQNNSTADAGVVNPFSSGLSTNSEKKSSNYNAGDLEATINVVFYTKK